ncbi:hypothetical protein PHMEG_0006550 [Phytophthora megakarya]|uniref:Apple domain-containing protein n=1 Tax=Phytophthora megakarya TaxID=4795 RepID=A0A225WNJ4_9STRA|nr:hypothetical protein PHMEG_0006550 [Phytophthora megakarya]
MQTPSLLVLTAAALASFLTHAAVTDTHQCYVEPDFDYVDNDIGNATSSTADGCCAKCEGTTGCKAYSWTDLNGGTCWLKSGRGTIIVKSGVQSASMQPLGNDQVGGCLLDEGIDYVGNDIGNVRMLKPLGCCSACLYFPGCRAFTFTTHNGGTCWLKSAKGPTIVNPAARSAQPYLEAPTCGLEFGVDYVGNDIGSAPASKPGDCCDACSKRDDCRAFSWTAQNGGTCWLKNRKDGSILKAGVTSAQVKANPASPSCALELDVDYKGNDIGNAQSSDPYACCSKCMAKSGCKAFSWSNYEGGTCWFKSAKGDTEVKVGVKSAIV